MEQILQLLKQYRPKEVYAISFILFICLFTRPSQIFDGHLDRVFDISRSIIYGLIRGVGDDRLFYDGAELLYWILLTIFVFLTFNKADKISKWLWNE